MQKETVKVKERSADFKSRDVGKRASLRTRFADGGMLESRCEFMPQGTVEFESSVHAASGPQGLCEFMPEETVKFESSVRAASGPLDLHEFMREETVKAEERSVRTAASGPQGVCELLLVETVIEESSVLVP